MTSRVLITGALGYLGGRVASYLESLPDYELVLAVRRAPSVTPAWLRSSTLAVVDLSSLNNAREVCEGVSAVVHLGAPNEIDAGKDPAGTIATTARDTLTLLQALPKPARFIYLSTAHVYGSPLAGDIDEETLPQPRHPYAISRRTSEDLVLAAHARKERTAAVLRLSNGLGAPVQVDHNRWTLLGNDLCRQAVETRKLILKSSGRQLRDFVAVSDVLRAIQHVIELPTEKLADGLFNLGGERTLSILEMTEIVAARCEAICGFHPEISVVPTAGEAAPAPLRIRIEKLKNTGFKLESNLEAEVDATLRFCLESFGGK